MRQGAWSLDSPQVSQISEVIVIRPSPTNPDPLTTYFASLSPHQHSDVQAAVNYMSQQFAEEVAKTQIPAHLLQQPPSSPARQAPEGSMSLNETDEDSEVGENDETNP